MNIISHGNLYKEFECRECQCKFGGVENNGYNSYIDRQRDNFEDRHTKDIAVKCPECNHKWVIRHVVVKHCNHDTKKWELASDYGYEIHGEELNNHYECKFYF